MCLAKAILEVASSPAPPPPASLKPIIPSKQAESGC